MKYNPKNLSSKIDILKQIPIIFMQNKFSISSGIFICKLNNFPIH